MISWARWLGVEWPRGLVMRRVLCVALLCVVGCSRGAEESAGDAQGVGGGAWPSATGQAAEGLAPVDCDVLAAEHDLGWPPLRASCKDGWSETRLYLLGGDDAGLAARWTRVGSTPAVSWWRLRFLNPDRPPPSAQEPGITCGGFVFAYEVERIVGPAADEELLGQRVRAIAALREVGSGRDFEDAGLLMAEACTDGRYERSLTTTAGTDASSRELRSLQEELGHLSETAARSR